MIDRDAPRAPGREVGLATVLNHNAAFWKIVRITVALQMQSSDIKVRGVSRTSTIGERQKVGREVQIRAVTGRLRRRRRIEDAQGLRTDGRTGGRLAKLMPGKPHSLNIANFI